jgi:hypothetical protein
VAAPPPELQSRDRATISLRLHGFARWQCLHFTYPETSASFRCQRRM